jgi:Domain of unknown function (DUF397)
MTAMDDGITGWRKSTHSANGACAEVAAWRASSRCASGECVEAGHGDAVVGVRDSQLEDSPVLVFPPTAWAAFTAAVRAAP